MEFNLINNKQKSNKMKKVFSSHASLSHAWANQTHEIGKSSAMFFEGPVIYSYGYHYEIARFIEAPNGLSVVFINSNGYSNSTAKHTNHVIRAIPENITKYYVPFVRSGGYYQKDNRVSIEKLPAIIENMALNCKNYCFNQIKARTNTSYFRQAASLYSNILEICFIFNLEAPNMPDNYIEAENKYNFLINTQTQRENIKAAKELEKSKELLRQAEEYCVEKNLTNYIDELVEILVRKKENEVNARKLNKAMQKAILIGDDKIYREIGFKMPLREMWEKHPAYFKQTIKEKLEIYKDKGYRLLNTNIPQQFLN